MTGESLVVFTHHARQRAAQMGVALVDVALAVDEPHVEYAQPDYGDGRRMHQRGDIAVPVVVLPDGRRLALTVLWRTQDNYTRSNDPRETA